MSDSLDVIRFQLSELKRGHSNCFHYYTGHFIVKVFTHREMEHPAYFESDRITLYEKVDVLLYEKSRYHNDDGSINQEFIDLECDIRFANYEPIKYADWKGYSVGREMPIAYLCELIQYLQRLSNLSAFI